jgi:hypothetical protein
MQTSPSSLTNGISDEFWTIGLKCGSPVQSSTCIVAFVSRSSVASPTAGAHSTRRTDSPRQARFGMFV